MFFLLNYSIKWLLHIFHALIMISIRNSFNKRQNSSSNERHCYFLVRIKSLLASHLLPFSHPSIPSHPTMKWDFFFNFFAQFIIIVLRSSALLCDACVMHFNDGRWRTANVNEIHHTSKEWMSEKRVCNPMHNEKLSVRWSGVKWR